LVNQNLAGICGIYCGDCKLLDKPCKGCLNQKGKMVSGGDCPVYVCCIERGLEHCGLCPDVPCKTLKEYVELWKELAEMSELVYYVPIEVLVKNLNRRKEIGTKKWIKEMEAKKRF
jgi:hypothetical protein